MLRCLMRDNGRKLANLPDSLRGTVRRPAAIERFGDVQGNILRPHGRPFAAHVFVAFDPGRLDDLRAWIAGFARTAIPSCADELAGSSAGPFGSFLLAASGYRALGIDPPPGRSFRDGMKRAALNDPPLESWDEAFRADLDAAVIVAGRDRPELDAALAALGPLFKLARSVAIEPGAELPGGVEHFGFIDGISQPIFLEEEAEAVRNARAGQLRWDPATPLHVVLARDPFGRGEECYGSYFVFRKLAQDVAVFESGVRAMAAALGVTEERAGAMIVGRFKDGTPLSMAASAGAGPVNDFAFGDDPAGASCPFASHVRRVNPRGELDHVAHTPDWQNRIARRGMPYGCAGDPDVGMLFMCYQSDIEGQFELIQSNWCNFPHFPVLRAGRDPLVGQRNSWDETTGQKWSAPAEDGTFATFEFPQCVTMRGGEYFFAPSLGFLRGLAPA
jgi:Dyp-type peroxidase family